MKSENILIVEDERLVAMDISQRLSEMGYGVCASVASGEEAIESASRLKPDLILMDIVLKGQVNGIEAAERIGRQQGIPIIYLTAYSDKGTLEGARRTGPYGYILKPFNDRVLQSNIEMAINKRSMEAEIEFLNQLILASRNVNQSIIRESDPERLIQRICDCLTDNDGFKSCWILIWNEIGGKIRAGSAGLGEKSGALGEYLKGGRLPECTRNVILNPGAVVLLGRENKCGACPLNCDLEEGSMLIGSLSHEGDLHGILAVNSLPDFVHKKEELAMIQEIAGDLALALHNAKVKIKLSETMAAYRKSKEKYLDLYHSAPDMYASVDAKTATIRECNQTAIDVLGYSRQEMIGKKVFELYSPQSAQRARKVIFPKFLKDGKIVGEQLQLKCKNKKIIEVLLNVSAVRDDAGNILHSHSSWRDISEKVRLEDRLRQSKKIEAIGTLAGGIAHDFNNILSSVIGFTELALDDLPKGSRSAGYLHEVYIAGKRAKDIVKQILTFARQTDDEIKPVRPDQIAREVLKLIRSSISATIEIEQNIRSESMIMGNTAQIHQLFMNLCTNAAFAMKDTGGRLTVSSEETLLDKPKTLPCGQLEPGNYVRIKVADTGIGISPDSIGSIFDPYFTTKGLGKGTGLGLALVHGIVKRYGGEVIVESTVGKGSVFTLYFHAVAATPETEPFKEKAQPGLDEHILFVDDEPAIAKMNRLILENMGYIVTSSTSSLKALSLFASRANDFDLVITDMTMPEMTGEKLAAELLKIRPDIPIILCTGYSKKISEKSASEIGIKALINKPVIKDELAVIVRSILDDAFKKR